MKTIGWLVGFGAVFALVGCAAEVSEPTPDQKAVDQPKPVETQDKDADRAYVSRKLTLPTIVCVVNTLPGSPTFTCNEADWTWSGEGWNNCAKPCPLGATCQLYGNEGYCSAK